MHKSLRAIALELEENYSTVNYAFQNMVKNGLLIKGEKIGEGDCWQEPNKKGQPWIVNAEKFIELYEQSGNRENLRRMNEKKFKRILEKKFGVDTEKLEIEEMSYGWVAEGEATRYLLMHKKCNDNGDYILKIFDSQTHKIILEIKLNALLEIQ